MSHASYHVKLELFEQYVLPVGLPTQFTLSTLLKVPNGSQSKTHISLGDWVVVSGTSLGLAESMSTALFESFCTYNMTQEEKLEHTRDELAWRQNGQRSTWLAQRQVPLPSFLLFVFCQQYSVPTASAFAHDVGLQNGPAARDAALKAMCQQHEKVTGFVTQHLYHLLALLAPNKYKVNLEQVRAFGTILTEVDGKGAMTPPGRFGASMPFWYKDRNALVDISVVQQFIGESFTTPTQHSYSPYELVSAKLPPKVQWPTQGAFEKSAVVRSISKSMLHKAVPLGANVQQVQIYACHHANIYLLTPLPNVTIFGCTHCNIILGPTSGIVSIEACEQVRVVAPTRGLRLLDAIECRAYVCVNTPPMVLMGCRSTELAPYNTNYPALESHLKQAGVNPLLNVWNTPVFIGKTDSSQPSVSIIAPQQFSSITIPFTNHAGNCHGNPCHMPPEYAAELKRKVTLASNTCKILHQAASSKNASKAEIAKMLNDNFKTWLQ
eukprot:gene23321-35711_t